MEGQNRSPPEVRADLAEMEADFVAQYSNAHFRAYGKMFG